MVTTCLASYHFLLPGRNELTGNFKYGKSSFRRFAVATEYGYPLKLRVPAKLGFKNPKHIAAIFVINDNPGGYWEDRGYNWFSGS